MNRDKILKEHYKEAERMREEQRELEENPLSAYSTSQLKAELRRRKREG